MTTIPAAEIRETLARVDAEIRQTSAEQYCRADARDCGRHDGELLGLNTGRKILAQMVTKPAGVTPEQLQAAIAKIERDIELTEFEEKTHGSTQDRAECQGMRTGLRKVWAALIVLKTSLALLDRMAQAVSKIPLRY